MNFLVKFLLRFRWLVIGLFIASTLFFGYFITKIIVDNDTFNSIPSTLKEKIEYEKLKKEFSTQYSVLFLAEFSSGTLSEKLDSLRSWEEDFKNLPGIANVANLNSVQIPVRGGFLIKSDYLISRKDSLEDEQIRERINSNREFSKLFISDDESTLGMVMNIQSMSERNTIFSHILSKSDQINQSSHIKTYMTSEGAVPYYITKIMKRDFTLLLPVCFILIFFLLYSVFKKFLYVVATLMVIVVALIWTFGLVGMFGIPFTVVLAIIPVIAFPIGVADAIHLLTTFTENKFHCKGNIEQALTITYKELVRPCLLTSLTTFASFISFGFSEISWTRYFGIFTGVAVVFAFIFNILLLPLFLSFDRKPAALLKKPSKENMIFNPFWDMLSRFTLESKKWIFIFPVLLVLCVIGFQMVEADSNPVSMLPENSSIRKSDAFIGKHFGGTRIFSVMLENKDSTLTSSAQWKTIQQIENYTRSQNGVGNVASILPLITRVSTMLSNEPFSGAAISMLTSTKEFFGKGYTNYINGFLSEDREKNRFTVTCQNSSDIDPLAIADSVRNYVALNFPNWNVTISGPALLTQAMGAILVETQISSLLYTFIPVFFCMVLFFKSFRIGLFSIFPIILATSFIYALMGLIGVTINSITVVTMNTCIGIGIDYAIHFISGYIYTIKNYEDRKTAIRNTIKNKGTPILFNTIVVGVGFLVLAFSSFPPNRDFGILVFLSMVVCALFSIIFLSVFISKFGLGRNIEGRKTV